MENKENEKKQEECDFGAPYLGKRCACSEIRKRYPRPCHRNKE